VNIRRTAFVSNYLATGNATQSYIDAGFSEKGAAQSAERLLRNAEIITAVTEARAKLAERTEITQDWVIKGLVNIAERCSQAVPVRDKKGNETGEWAFNAAGANTAYQLIGKHLGMFSDKLSVTFMREQAQAIADESGLDVDEIVAEAQRWMAGKAK